MNIELRRKLIKKVTVNDRAQMIYDRKLKKIKYAMDREKIISLEMQYIDFYNKKISINDLFEPNICNEKDDKPKTEVIKDFIHGITYVFYVRKKNASRITREDFLSVAYEKAWETIENYSYKHPRFLFQYIKLNVRNACIDLLRNQGLTKDRSMHPNAAFHQAKPLNVQTDEQKLINHNISHNGSTLEREVILKISLDEAIATFNKNELKIYRLFLNSDNIELIKLKDICSELELKHPMQAKRILEQIKKKVSDFETTPVLNTKGGDKK